LGHAIDELFEDDTSVLALETATCQFAMDVYGFPVPQGYMSPIQEAPEGRSPQGARIISVCIEFESSPPYPDRIRLGLQDGRTWIITYHEPEESDANFRLAGWLAPPLQAGELISDPWRYANGQALLGVTPGAIFTLHLDRLDVPVWPAVPGAELGFIQPAPDGTWVRRQPTCDVVRKVSVTWRDGDPAGVALLDLQLEEAGEVLVGTESGPALLRLAPSVCR
jgi:hypothetical protein